MMKRMTMMTMNSLLIILTHSYLVTNFNKTLQTAFEYLKIVGEVHLC